jgi:predicted MFS family arabinose efflux permease
MSGSMIGLLGSLLSAYAALQGNFLLLCIGTFMIGASSAFVQQYRFGAVESVPPDRSGQAVSYVLLGGIAAGFLGPEIAKRTQGLIPAGAFSASFIFLAGLFGVAIALLYMLNEISVHSDQKTEAGRPLREVILQPNYIAAVVAGAVAYGVMSFIMTATPVEMHTMMGFSLSQTAWVIQSHIIAMYVPSLFTGFLLARLGLRRVMTAGVFCLLTTVGLGIISANLLMYWAALVLLGVGWNFLYVGATVLLTRSYRPSERFRAQAFNDFTIFGIQAFTSLSAGTVLFQSNWNTLLLLNLPALALMLVIIGAGRQQFVEAEAG